MTPSRPSHCVGASPSTGCRPHGSLPFETGLQAAPLAGAVVLVVGATDPDGPAVCRRFASLGATVYVAGRDLDAAVDLAVGLGPRAHALPLDPASEADWTVALGYLRFAHDGADLVVHCQGRAAPSDRPPPTPHSAVSLPPLPLVLSPRPSRPERP